MTLQYIQNRAIFLNIAAVLDRNYTSRHSVFSFYLQAKSDKNNLWLKKKIVYLSQPGILALSLWAESLR